MFRNKPIIQYALIIEAFPSNICTRFIISLLCRNVQLFKHNLLMLPFTAYLTRDQIHHTIVCGQQKKPHPVRMGLLQIAD